MAEECGPPFVQKPRGSGSVCCSFSNLANDERALFSDIFSQLLLLADSWGRTGYLSQFILSPLAVSPSG